MMGAAKVDGDFVLILRGSDISILRSNTMLLSKFEHEFQSKVWFVEAEANDKRFIENLFFPMRVLTVNLIWLPDGNKLTRVLIDNKSNNNSESKKTTIEKIKKIAKEIRNIELLVEFE
jgi:transcription antitermination factor NusA-like protein